IIEYQPACRYAVTATMNIARNTRDIPINGIFANKSTRAMRPTSIDRMTVVTVNTFRRCGARRMDDAPFAWPGRAPAHVHSAEHALLKQVCAASHATGSCETLRHPSRAVGHRHRLLDLG